MPDFFDYGINERVSESNETENKKKQQNGTMSIGSGKYDTLDRADDQIKQRRLKESKQPANQEYKRAKSNVANSGSTTLQGSNRHPNGQASTQSKIIL